MRAARQALGRIWKDGYRYKKAGIELHDLQVSDIVQGDLWIAADCPRRSALMTAIDGINTKHGRATVRFAASGFAQGWRLRAENRSPHYTTDWEELLRVA